MLGGWFILQMYGVIPLQVPVSGASMLPTLPTEGFVSFQRYIADDRIHKIIPQPLQRGDIVVFRNKETAAQLRKKHEEGSGFVKRIIGLPGDTISIRDGFAYVNGQVQQEAYTFKPRSTFGGLFIQDCQEVKVSEGKFFVLGDNRKVSMDSREIGLVDSTDIEFYIPFSKQNERFGSLWRDPKNDLSTQHQSLFDVKEYVGYLNEERRKNNLPPLVYEPKLERSARLRAEAMLKYNDFSFEAKQSGYKMEQAMRDAGYSNTVFGEFPMTGYYDAKELFDAFVEQPRSATFLLNKDYDDIGVSTFVGELQGCPVQVVVQHLAGYVPPNYKGEEIQSWRDGLKNLESIKPGWAQIKEAEEFYQKHKTDIDRINELIDQRILRYKQVIKRMDANEWFSSEEKAWIADEEKIGKEQNEIAERINKSQ